MNYRQACSSTQRLSKKSLLSMLHSNQDRTRGIIVSTGEVVNLEGLPQNTINNYLKNGTLVYFEESQPRQMLLLQPNWAISSFDPENREVCVQMYTNSGMRPLSISLVDFLPKNI